MQNRANTVYNKVMVFRDVEELYHIVLLVPIIIAIEGLFYTPASFLGVLTFVLNAHLVYV